MVTPVVCPRLFGFLTTLHSELSEEITSCQQQFETIEKKRLLAKICACQLACLCLDMSSINGRSVGSSSELTLISSVVFPLGSTAACSTTRLCESGWFTREVFSDQSPDAWAPGICNWSPDAFAETSGERSSLETATIGTWFSDKYLVTLSIFS